MRIEFIKKKIRILNCKMKRKNEILFVTDLYNYQQGVCTYKCYL